jgi:transposase
MLENWAKRRKTAQGLALRARIVLACAEGRSNVAVAARLGVSRATVKSGGPGSWSAGWTGWAMSPGPGWRAPSATPRWRRWWCGP